MAGGTSGIRRVGTPSDKSVGVAAPSRAISPVGNRTLVPTIKRAPRRPPHDGRSYDKTTTGGGFNIPGFGQSPEE